MPWILASLQAAITLCWVIYNFYLPTLLQNAGLDADVAMGIQLLENGVAAVAEPVMGAMSDWTRYRMGSRFPVIGAGILGAAGIFALIPGGQGQTIVVALLVLWAFAMSVFRSPALALLGKAVAAQEQTQAVAALTFLAGVVGGLAPITHTWMVAQGPTVTFAVGSIVLLLTGMALRWVPPPSPPLSRPYPLLGWDHWGILCGLGLLVATVFRMMLIHVAALIPASDPFWTPSGLIAGILLISGLVALPCGWWGQRVGEIRMIQVGLILMVAGLGVSAALPGWVWVWLGLCGTGWSLVATGAVSHTLAHVAGEQAGLALGLYFGGFAAAMALINTYLAVWGSLPSPLILGTLAAFTGILLVALPSPRPVSHEA